MVSTIAVAFVGTFACATAFQPSIRGINPKVVPQSVNVRSCPSSFSQSRMSLDYQGGDDPNNANYGRLSDRLKAADVERRLEDEEAQRRLDAADATRKLRERNMEKMNAIPDETVAGKVSDYMYKEGVQDILDKLDYDLVGLKPVKARVKEIASSCCRQNASEAWSGDCYPLPAHGLHRSSWNREDHCCSANGSNLAKDGILSLWTRGHCHT